MNTKQTASVSLANLRGTELLTRLYSIHSPSRKGGKMRQFLYDYVANIADVTIDEDKTGNLYITKGKSERYACLAAHIDQVQQNHSDDFTAVVANGIVFGYSATNKRFEGLGADDKNGIYIALEALREFPTLKVYLAADEEIGCVGTLCANMDFFNDVRYVVECDRKGNSDLITNASGTKLCGKDFVKAVNHKEYGYNVAQGMLTDVRTLKERGLKVACVNLSCGYYNPHTDTEFTILADLEKCRKFVFHIIKDVQGEFPHEYTAPKPMYNDFDYAHRQSWRGYGYGGHDYHGDYYRPKHMAHYDKVVTRTAASSAIRSLLYEEAMSFDEVLFNLPTNCYEGFGVKELRELYDEQFLKLYHISYEDWEKIKKNRKFNNYNI